MRVMTVDDEDDIREMINLLLQKQGYETETAQNGEDFLKKLESFQPDLVTLDVMMPGLTTEQILEKIKDKKCNPMIILVTVVHFSKEEIEIITDLGNIVDYVNKPFELDEFINIIDKYVSRIASNEK
jgi:DNA-binding response OmpR family regulator